MVDRESRFSVEYQRLFRASTAGVLLVVAGGGGAEAWTSPCSRFCSMTSFSRTSSDRKASACFFWNPKLCSSLEACIQSSGGA